MNYLLDTNACITLINGQPASVRVRFQEVITAGAATFVSTIVLFELWYGVDKSSRQVFNRERLTVFLHGPISLLHFDEEDARFAGAIRAFLERRGKPVGAYDVLIAGQALRHKFTLVTADTREFSRIEGLAWEDWASTTQTRGRSRT